MVSGFAADSLIQYYSCPFVLFVVNEIPVVWIGAF
jgi:hypothetical protein